MKTITRLTTSVLVAILTALFINTIVFAASGPYAITETPLTHYFGNYGVIQPLTNSYCLNGNSLIGTGGACKYILGETANYDSFSWAKTKIHAYNIYAFNPRIGASIAKYTWWETSSHQWNINSDQSLSSHLGQWVFLGFSDYSTTNAGGKLILSNDCSGWTCGKKILYDSMRYTTNP